MVFFGTYDFTKTRLGILLLDARAVRLRVQEERGQGSLGAIGVLCHWVSMYSSEMVRGVIVRPTYPYLGCLLAAALAGGSDCDRLLLQVVIVVLRFFVFVHWFRCHGDTLYTRILQSNPNASGEAVVIVFLVVATDQLPHAVVTPQFVIRKPPCAVHTRRVFYVPAVAGLKLSPTVRLLGVKRLAVNGGSKRFFGPVMSLPAGLPVEGVIAEESI
jgi:hypothetical protein